MHMTTTQTTIRTGNPDIDRLMDYSVRLGAEHGVEVRCPTCNAGIGKFCRDENYVRILHPARVEAAAQ